MDSVLLHTDSIFRVHMRDTIAHVEIRCAILAAAYEADTTVLSQHGQQRPQSHTPCTPVPYAFLNTWGSQLSSLQPFQ
jgi:hypothetical protein